MTHRYKLLRKWAKLCLKPDPDSYRDYRANLILLTNANAGSKPN